MSEHGFYAPVRPALQIIKETVVKIHPRPTSPPLRALVPTLVLVAALAACDRDGDRLVARAADYELSVDRTVELLAGAGQVPNQPEVVRALADIWIDYTLLAHAAIQDTSLENVDLSPLVRQQVEQEMIFALRDSVIQPDTAISAEELERLFEQQAPGAEVRARHILLGFPQGATQAQRDSVRALAQELRQRAAGGGDFAELAGEYSQDPGSAAQGGDLGFFGRGDMVRPFEEAAFALQPGEVSDVVESPYGYHVIQVEERRTPTLEDRADQFRGEVQQQRYAEAESTFIAGIEEAAGMQVIDDAVDVTRQIAENPDMRLSARATRRPLVEYEGGELTVGELRSFLQTRQPQYRQQVAAAEDETIEEGVLRALTQRELLVAEAESRGFEPPQAEQDSVEALARESFVEASRQIGLASIEPAEGETPEEAVERRVDEMLEGVLAGTQDVVPLGPISYALRQEYRAEIYENGVQEVVDQVETLRGPAAAPGQQPMPQGAPPQGAPPQGAPPQGAPGGGAPGVDTPGAVPPGGTGGGGA